MTKDITGLLRDNGFKVTPQRLAVYKTLYESKEHPTAEMLFNELHPSYPTMSLATVYKTIEILAELKLIKILNTGEDSFRYDADTCDHAHIKCLGCKKVEDIMTVKLGNMVADVKKQTGYSIVSQQVYFYGHCPRCNKSRIN